MTKEMTVEEAAFELQCAFLMVNTEHHLSFTPNKVNGPLVIVCGYQGPRTDEFYELVQKFFERDDEARLSVGRTLWLTHVVRFYNYMYYVQSQSVVTDLEFDTLLQELKELEEKYPENALSGSPVTNVASDKEIAYADPWKLHPGLFEGGRYDLNSRD